MPSGVDVDTPVMNGGAAERPPHIMSMAPANDQRENGSQSGGSPKVTTSSRETMNGIRNTSPDEGVEVVLGTEGNSEVVDNKLPDQNVFRAPHAVRPRAMRVPSHQPHGPPPPHPGYFRGSWGPYHGRPPPREAYRGPPPHGPMPVHPSHHHHPQQHHRRHHPSHPHPPPHGPYPVPSYPTASSSGSFDDQGYHNTHPPPPTTSTPQFSPHIHYPTGPNAPRATGYHGPSDDVNVISPNHKTDIQPQHHHAANPISPPQRRPPVYSYPPASPVSRPGQQTKPLIRNHAMRRPDFGRSSGRDYDYSTYPAATERRHKKEEDQPPLVGDSFDSSHHNRSGPAAFDSSIVKSPGGRDPSLQQMYTSAGSWGSFDSSVHHLDDRVYQHGFPPDSPYSPFHQSSAGPPVYSPGGHMVYAVDSFPSPHINYGHGPPPMPHAFSYSYDDEEHHMLRDYHPDYDGGPHRRHARSKATTPVSSNRSGRPDLSSLIPKAAEEIDFCVTDPPIEPITPPSSNPVCQSMADVNGYDVLHGRGGGTNSQVGNRRFRQLVAEFQPIYLEAKRKEKPLLARTIVLIIRKRGGRFLKKNEDTGQLFEVGDDKAEAKTSQALREGLDVRATRSAANLSKKKKKPKATSKSPTLESSEESPRAESPPALPKLHEDESPKSGVVHPHSPDHSELRKRRRLRTDDRFFNDFMPPRANMTPRNEDEDDGVLDNSHETTPVHRNTDTDTPMECNSNGTHTSTGDCNVAAGCAGIALDVMSGAAQSSFCLGPRGWRR